MMRTLPNEIGHWRLVSGWVPTSTIKECERGHNMSNSLETTVDRDRASIAVVRKAWVEAVVAGDADRLADLVTSDVVAVHANGRCTCGKDDVRRFFIDAFNKFDIEGKTSSSDVVVHGIWAVEIDEIQTKRTQYDAPVSEDVSLQAVFIFARQLDGSWKVARIIELPD
jgi:ketosteroid isomerase-like protein